MDNQEITKKCNAFLKELGVPGFIVFGFQKSEKQVGVVYANHKLQPGLAVKGITWALNDLVQKKL